MERLSTRRSEMKKAIVLLSVILLGASFNASAYIKCAPDGRGGTCCWDTDKDGPWKPIGC